VTYNTVNTAISVITLCIVEATRPRCVRKSTTL